MLNIISLLGPSRCGKGAIIPIVAAVDNFELPYNTPDLDWYVDAYNSGDISSGVTIDRTNERLTPTVAGTYLVQTQLMFSYSTGGSNIQFVVFQYKNGSEYAYNTQDQYRGSGLVSNVICQSLMTFNGSSDYVEMWAKHNGGGNAIMGVASTFMITRIG